MNADTFFIQGTTHKVCQDYALSCYSPSEDEVAIVVCDGCSSADVDAQGQEFKPPETRRRVNNTDTGVRLLARAAMRHVFKDIGLARMYNDILKDANDFRQAMSLEPECLFDTLMVAHASYGGISVQVVGDGVVALRKRDTGVLNLYEISFTNGAPYYLQYETEARYRQLYSANCGRAKYELRRYTVQPNGDVTLDPFTPLPCEVPLHDDRGIFYMSFRTDGNYEDYDLVALMSDGVSQVSGRTETLTSRSSDAVPMAEVVKHLLCYKNYNGAFVQRRCNRAMLTFQKLEWQPLDDLSVAAIYLPSKEETP